MACAFGQHHGRRRTKALLSRLHRHEVPQVMDHLSNLPIVMSGATGARVKDADGNRYIDMSSFFGVGLVGHRNPTVVARVRKAIGHLTHAMGDVHPGDTRAELLARLSALMPAPDYRGLLSLNGSDAVETALKFAAAATGRGGIISFEGAYHGLSAGALECTWRPDFRRPFAAGICGRAVFAPYPAADGSDLKEVLARVERLADSEIPGFGKPGALIVEPVQGRGGIRVAPPGFVKGLAEICRARRMAFIADEIYSGAWRTGTFLAVNSDDAVPDVVCLGKAVGGGFPLSVAMMRPWLADAVSSSHGEAVHTSTFLGWPVSCAAGLGVLTALERMAPGAEAARIEAAVGTAACEWKDRFDFIRGIRGRGAMLGIETAAFGAMKPADVSMAIVTEALHRGVILLPEGPEADVVAVTPPLVIEPADLDTAVRIIGEAIETVAGVRPAFENDPACRPKQDWAAKSKKLSARKRERHD